MDYIFIEFDRSPDGPVKIGLEKKTVMTREGFGFLPATYPVTIVQARYGGSYEGGGLGTGWLCFPVAPHRLPEKSWRDWCGSDIECMMWWDRARDEQWPIGHGSDPSAAYLNLIQILCEKAGINPDDWSAEPTWDRDELRRRDGEDHP